MFCIVFLMLNIIIKGLNVESVKYTFSFHAALSKIYSPNSSYLIRLCTVFHTSQFQHKYMLLIQTKRVCVAFIHLKNNAAFCKTVNSAYNHIDIPQNYHRYIGIIIIKSETFNFIFESLAEIKYTL